MDMSMEKWYEASSKRFSVRKYKSEPRREDIESLKEFASEISTDSVRIEIGSSDKVFASRLLGSGKIKGTTYFAAFISEEGKTMEIGYIGEIFMLECVARNIGTCWLGVSFRMGAAQEAIDLSDEEGIVCITPLGISDEPFKLRTRRTMTDLTGLSVQDFVKLPRHIQSAFECARRAPSAINAQPWSFKSDGDTFSVIKTSNNLGYGDLDCGIAMLHAEIGAAHHSVVGEWDLTDEKESVFIPYTDVESENEVSIPEKIENFEDKM
ncbi:MAG: nitroreductase family protein [Clostridia bacterium]